MTAYNCRDRGWIYPFKFMFWWLFCSVCWTTAFSSLIKHWHAPYDRKTFTVEYELYKTISTHWGSRHDLQKFWNSQHLWNFLNHSESEVEMEDFLLLSFCNSDQLAASQWDFPVPNILWNYRYKNSCQAAKSKYIVPFMFVVWGRRFSILKHWKSGLYVVMLKIIWDDDATLERDIENSRECF